MSERAEEITGLLAAIVASSDDAIISKNLDGIITSWNKSAERIFGYTSEEAIGHHITLIIPQERHAEESDILSRLRRGERVDHFHTVRRRKDGSLLDVSLTISPVRDPSGRVVGASKVARDITAEKQTEQALRESEQRFRVITDASPIMVWMAGTDKLCYYFSKGWLDFVGRSLQQESGNGWTENVHPEDFDRCLQIYLSNSMLAVHLKWNIGCGITLGNTAGSWIEECRATRPMECLKDMSAVVSISMARKRQQRRFGLPTTWHA
jgi:PAS domain S-box-containing protein